MNIMKQKTGLTNSEPSGKEQKMMSSGRETFIWKAGAVFTATISSVLLGTRPGFGKTADHENKVFQLYDRTDQMENSDARGELLCVRDL